MREKFNIKDVAKEAGVSIATVSRVVNKLSSVKRINREKVERAIKRLKFRPNIAAQRLAAKKKNYVVGLVIPRYEDVFGSFYAMQIIKGVGLEVEHLKLDLLLHLTSKTRFINLSAIDGLIFADIIGNEEQLDYCLNNDFPCVVMNYFTEELPVSCIAIDNFNAARQVVDYLTGLGHTRIATITGDLRTQVAIERLNGYIDGLQRNNIEKVNDYIKYGDFGKALAQKLTEELLKLKPKPTAIFAASDDMALGVMEKSWELGFKVPQEISIVGFDDSPAAYYSPVPLTTVRQPLVKMGIISVQTLEQVISGKLTSHKKIKLPTELIYRASCQQVSSD